MLAVLFWYFYVIPRVTWFVLQALKNAKKEQEEKRNKEYQTYREGLLQRRKAARIAKEAAFLKEATAAEDSKEEL